ncbi:MAG: ABC transporter permease [Saprospiraceae bacterium]|nr:ABC transporter permease [Saprospiraceae bacterium]
MWYQIIQIHLRKLGRDKGYTAINLLGLSLGILTFLFITLWVKDELTYDRFHQKADDIVRVLCESRSENGALNWVMTSTPWLMAPHAKTDIAGVKETVRIWNGGQMKLTDKTGKTQFERPTIVDPTFFEIFDFPSLEGDENSWLDQPNKVLLSRALAAKVFPNGDIIGKELFLQDTIPLTVSGVIADMPSNSSFDYDLILSSKTVQWFKPEDMQNWGNWNFSTFLHVAEGVDRVTLGNQLTQLYRKNSGSDESFAWFVQDVADMHLYSDFTRRDGRSTQVLSIYYLMGIAFLVLIIACINYTNLATARASKQTKAVSIRKVVGASRKNLFSFLLGETVLLTTMALVLSLTLLQLLFPLFNSMMGKKMIFAWWEPSVIGVVLLGMGLTIALSGIYPAVMLSSFSPIKYLRGDAKVGNAKGRFGRLLLIGQFAITAILITSTLVIFQQLNYLRAADLGYAKENIFTFRLSEEMQEKPDLLRQQFQQHPDIQAFSLTNQPIYRIGSWTDGIAWPGHVDKGEIKIRRLSVDPNFFDFFGIGLASGESFEGKSEQRSYMLNETARKMLGMETAEGELISLNRREGRVLGVVEDFHIRSLREKIEPLILYPNTNYAGQAYIKVSRSETPAALAAAQTIWESFDPSSPFNYTFLDEAYAAQYEQEERTGKLLNISSSICILIALIGLLGLVAFALVQRTKEIGIRKVLGAQVIDIIQLIAKDYVRLIGIGIGIAIPVAWYFLQKWLAEFAYSIELRLAPFLLAGIIVLLLALAVLCGHILRTTRANPVQALRQE